MIPGGDQVSLEVPPNLPEAIADPGLLERAIANIVENAMRYTPEDERLRIAGSAYADTVELRIIDRGPGIRGTPGKPSSNHSSATTTGPSAAEPASGSAWL